ncbi:MAG: hypothetical protein WBD71_17215 [Xanthobacteraceae bacterium]
MKIIPTALALVGMVMIGPTMAAARNDGSSVKMKPGAIYNYVPGVLNIGPNDSAVARDQAIHDCSTQASKWSFSTWQTKQFAVYGTCMADHGQVP